ncbi:MAG: hypothetical protein J6N81_06920, partial [Treponema sp.]|nr:hypothetical protein [Treponema sp.]
NAPSGAATSQSAIDLNVSESRDLSLSLGTEPYRLCSNHPFDGWFVIGKTGCFDRKVRLLEEGILQINSSQSWGVHRELFLK